MTELKIYYPTGLIAQIDYSPAPSRFNIVQPLSDPGLMVNGDPGAYPIQQLNMTDIGTLEVFITLGAPGANRAVAFLVDQWPNPTKYVGIALDDTNRPLAYLSVDGAGTILGEGLPNGGSNPQGNQLKLRLSYNLRTPIHLGSTAFLQVGDIGQEIWAVEPGVAPGLFQPKFLILGYQVFTNYLAFNGTITWGQTCDVVNVLAETPIEQQEETSTVGMLDQPLDFPL